MDVVVFDVIGWQAKMGKNRIMINIINTAVIIIMMDHSLTQ
jgi:hypothetical protein